jgi:hypothetical protein
MRQCEESRDRFAMKGQPMKLSRSNQAYLDVDCARERCLLGVVALQPDTVLAVGNGVCSNRRVMARRVALAEFSPSLRHGSLT